MGKPIDILKHSFGPAEFPRFLYPGSYGSIIEILFVQFVAKKSIAWDFIFSEKYSEVMVNAMKRFQIECGLLPDGIIDDSMWKAFKERLEIDRDKIVRSAVGETYCKQKNGGFIVWMLGETSEGEIDERRKVTAPLEPLQFSEDSPPNLSRAHPWIVTDARSGCG